MRRVIMGAVTSPARRPDDAAGDADVMRRIRRLGAFKPWGKASNTSILLQANNLFDVEARRATSVLKDYAPLAGRDLRATLRVQL